MYCKCENCFTPENRKIFCKIERKRKTTKYSDKQNKNIFNTIKTTFKHLTTSLTTTLIEARAAESDLNNVAMAYKNNNKKHKYKKFYLYFILMHLALHFKRRDDRDILNTVRS